LSNDYNDLEQAVATVTKAFEVKQKNHILQSAKLELEVLNNQRNSIFVEGSFKISNMIYLWKTDIEEPSEAEIHHVIKELIIKDTTLLTHVFNSKYKDFATRYNVLYPLSVDIINPAGINVTTINGNELNEVPDQEMQATMDQYFPRAVLPTATNNQQLLSTQDSATVTTLANTDTQTDEMDDDYELIPTHHHLHESDLLKLLRILKEVFVASWSTELRKINNRLIELKMAKFIKTTSITTATDAAAAVVANEPAADMQQLNELIEKKVEE
jgi:hypothetical protein